MCGFAVGEKYKMVLGEEAIGRGAKRKMALHPVSNHAVTDFSFPGMQ